MVGCITTYVLFERDSESVVVEFYFMLTSSPVGTTANKFCIGIYFIFKDGVKFNATIPVEDVNFQLWLFENAWITQIQFYFM